MFYKKSEKRHIFLIFWIEKNAFSTSKVKFYKRSKKSIFLKGLRPWFFLSKNKLFFYVSFEQKKNQKETFFHILDRKEYFLDLKSDILQRG